MYKIYNKASNNEHGWTLCIPLRGNSVCILLMSYSGLEIFSTKFCSSDPSFNRNVLTSLYVKSEISADAQLRNYLFMHITHKFHDMVSVGNFH